MNIMLKRLFNKVSKKQVLWFQVPMNCNTRREKDFLISDLLNQLEQKIKINK
jgi:hypothetical protein